MWFVEITFLLPDYSHSTNVTVWLTMSNYLQTVNKGLMMLSPARLFYDLMEIHRKNENRFSSHLKKEIPQLWPWPLWHNEPLLYYKEGDSLLEKLSQIMPIECITCVILRGRNHMPSYDVWYIVLECHSNTILSEHAWITIKWFQKMRIEKALKLFSWQTFYYGL